MTWRPHLIFWLLILLAPFFLWLLGVLALRRRLDGLYLRRFENPRRERLFLSAVSFLIAFSAARSVAHAVHREAIGFRGIFVGTTHEWKSRIPFHRNRLAGCRESQPSYTESEPL
jgi:hypothetical protein